MLPFEIAILSLGALLALVLLVTGKGVHRVLASGALFASIALEVWQYRVEERHWQMWPGLLAIFLLATVVFLPPRSARLIRGVAIVALLLIGSSLTASTILPMFQIPAATGHYRVGTVILHLVDNSRHEGYLSDPAARREINIQLWYPTDATTGNRAAYRRVAETTFLSRYQSAIATEAFENVPMASPHGANPIVLFNPAWNGLRTQDTFETIDLASHGFVVVAIDHT